MKKEQQKHKRNEEQTRKRKKISVNFPSECDADLFPFQPDFDYVINWIIYSYYVHAEYSYFWTILYTTLYRNPISLSSGWTSGWTKITTMFDQWALRKKLEHLRNAKLMRCVARKCLDKKFNFRYNTVEVLSFSTHLQACLYMIRDLISAWLLSHTSTSSRY